MARKPRVYREFNGVKVTETQWFVLDALKRYRRYSRYDGGWAWENHSTTVRILDALVRKGLVAAEQRRNDRTGETYLYYTPAKEK